MGHSWKKFSLLLNVHIYFEWCCEKHYFSPFFLWWVVRRARPVCLCVRPSQCKCLSPNICFLVIHFTSVCWEWPTHCSPVPCGPWWPLLFQNTSWEPLMACKSFSPSGCATLPRPCPAATDPLSAQQSKHVVGYKFPQVQPSRKPRVVSGCVW